MANKSEETHETFSARMCDVAVAGHTMVGLAVGVSLGLFDTMCQLQQPFTIQELAAKAKCKERYIQEWINHMAVTDVVDVDESGSKFTFPEHRRDALTSQDEIIPGTASPFPYLMLPHRELLECIKADGPNGLPFSAVAPVYEEYNRLPSEQADAIACADHAIDSIPGLREKLETGILVCDVGSGGGNVSIHMAKRFPSSTFVGFELDEGQLALSHAALKDTGISNLTFLQQNACAIPDKWTSSFDFVIMREVFHDIPFASKCAQELFRCLKPDGSLALFEFFTSSNVFETGQNATMKLVGQFLYPVSLYHCLAASMHADGSEGLGACAGKEKLCQIMQNAGFTVKGQDQMGETFKFMMLCVKSG